MSGQEMVIGLREQLAAALASVDRQYAVMALNKRTRIAPLAAPFLTNYQIYCLDYPTSSRPVQLHLGFALGRPLFVLTDRPENFEALASEDGVNLSTVEEAEAYAALYLELTAPGRDLFYLLDSVAGILFRPELSPTEVERRRQVEQLYQERVVPLRARPTGEGYEVTAYALHGHDLERLVLALGRQGEVALARETLEADLPTVYWR